MKSPKETIRFNRKDVPKDIDRLKALARRKFDPSAGRYGFYDYLAEVYRYVLAHKAKDRQLLRNSLKEIRGLETPRSSTDAFYLAISLTCPKPKRSRSKYAIALSNAEEVEIPPEQLVPILRSIGGPSALGIRLPDVKIRHTIRRQHKIRGLRQPKWAMDTENWSRHPARR